MAEEMKNGRLSEHSLTPRAANFTRTPQPYTTPRPEATDDEPAHERRPPADHRDEPQFGERPQKVCRDTIVHESEPK
jgi:hypothetical protein